MTVGREYNNFGVIWWKSPVIHGAKPCMINKAILSLPVKVQFFFFFCISKFYPDRFLKVWRANKKKRKIFFQIWRKWRKYSCGIQKVFQPWLQHGMSQYIRLCCRVFLVWRRSSAPWLDRELIWRASVTTHQPRKRLGPSCWHLFSKTKAGG